MAGTFTIQITGDVLKPGYQQIFISVIRPRLDRFSTDYDVKVTGFLRKSYRIEVEGTPDNFDYIDNLIDSIKLHIIKYLRKWAFSVKVNLTERG